MRQRAANVIRKRISRRQATALLLAVFVLGIVAWSVSQSFRQERLDRALITALQQKQTAVVVALPALEPDAFEDHTHLFDPLNHAPNPPMLRFLLAHGSDVHARKRDNDRGLPSEKLHLPARRVMPSRRC